MSILRNGLIASLMVLVFLNGVPIAQAQTSTLQSTLQARIDALLAQLKALQAQMPAAAAASVATTTPAITVNLLSTQAVVTGTSTDAYGTYTLVYEVTPDDTDMYIPRTAGIEQKKGIQYVIGPNNTFKGKNSAVLQSTATVKDGYYLVKEGTTKKFTLTVVLDPNTASKHAIGLEYVWYNPMAGAPTKSYRIEKDFVTNFITIPNGSTTTKPAVVLDTYRGYVNGAVVSEVAKMNEENALRGCKMLAERNSTSRVMCTWGSKTIFDNKVVPKPTATLNKSSLTATSGNPTISGSATGLSKIGISIGNGDKVYGSGLIPVKSNKWSVTVEPALVNGTYTVQVYSPENKELTTGKLKVTGSISR